MAGLCPLCREVLASVTICNLPGRASDGSEHVAVSYACGRCNCVISIDLAPVRLEDPLMKSVEELALPAEVISLQD